MKGVRLPKDFPISKVAAELDIYINKERRIGDYIYLELNDFDGMILEDYLKCIQITEQI